MKPTSIFSLYFVLLLLALGLLECLCDVVKKPILRCEVGNIYKCIGTQGRNHGTAKDSSKLLKYLNNTVQSKCFYECLIGSNCLMAIFSSSSRLCGLYANQNLDRGLSTSTVFLWNCCNTSTSYFVPGRCGGYWRFRRNYRSVNTVRIEPLKVSKSKSVFRCLQLCLSTLACGAVNIQYADESDRSYWLCEMVLGFPPNKLKSGYNFTWAYYEWQCSDSYVLLPPPRVCKNRPFSFRGFWSVSKFSLRLPEPLSSVINFYSYDLADCLVECLEQNGCKRAWYSQNGFKCVLEALPGLYCSDTYQESFFDLSVYSFFYYDWTQCFYNSVKTKRSLHMDSLAIQSGQCRKLIRNEHAWISAVFCGQDPTISNVLTKCVDIDTYHERSTSYSIVFRCQTSQSFTVARTTEYNGTVWVMVSSGFETFWLVNVSVVDFPIAEDCPLYDASEPHKSDQHPVRIINRDQWFNLRPQHPQLNFSRSPVLYAVVSNTGHPYCSCFTEAACSDRVRFIQTWNRPKFDQLPFNFGVTQSGLVYEFKGWDYQDHADNNYNSVSLSIAMIGVFDKRPPMRLALASIRHLLRFAVQRGKLTGNYSLLLHDDVSDVQSRASALYRVVALWPHFRGHMSQPCASMGFIVQLLTALLLMLLIVYFLMYRVIHRRYCRLLAANSTDFFFLSPDNCARLQTQITAHDLRSFSSTFSIFNTDFFWIEPRFPLPLPQLGSAPSSPCLCRYTLLAAIDLHRYQTKMLQFQSLLQALRHLCPNNCSIELVIRVKEERATVILGHFTEPKHTSQFVYSLHSCLCATFLLHKYLANSHHFKLANRSKTIGKTTILQASPNPIPRSHIRSQLENQFCYVMDSSMSENYFMN